MVTRDVERASEVWTRVAPIVFVPRSEDDHDRLVQVMDALIDVVGEDEEHQLASLMEVIGTLIEKYEDDHVPEPAGRH
jgi:HTH-type transcriptional regulator / antitoxin HigA